MKQKISIVLGVASILSGMATAQAATHAYKIADCHEGTKKYSFVLTTDGKKALRLTAPGLEKAAVSKARIDFPVEGVYTPSTPAAFVGKFAVIQLTDLVDGPSVSQVQLGWTDGPKQNSAYLVHVNGEGETLGNGSCTVLNKGLLLKLAKKGDLYQLINVQLPDGAEDTGSDSEPAPTGFSHSAK
jgi:hypothetical protein